MYSLSNKAGRDLDFILDYSIINFGIEVTIDYHDSLEKCFEILDENPDLGTEIEYICSDYLCFEHRSHLIFYKKTEDVINEANNIIIRLLHKSMNVQQHFRTTQ